MIRIVIATLALLLAATSLAHAEPITIALFGAAFASTVAGSIVTLLITTAFSYGIGLLQKALAKKPEQMPQGVQFQIQMGDNSPLAFPAGQYATAGTRKYIGTWGQDGKTPNAYLSDVLQIADIPLPGRPGLWVNGKKCTILWDETPSAQGYPVEEFREDGKDYFWVRYADGTQTSADSFLIAKFGSDAERPWKSTMIGRGCPFLVTTARVNREMFPGNMEYLIEPPVPHWYDLRKDSTAGGSGSHRWNDPATWEETENPATIIYNIIRGVYYGDEWVFGGQNLPAFRLPASNWMAAMNECDAAIPLEAGGTEKQFRCGYMIDGDMEPLAVIEELEKACNGHVAEVGGIFKMLIGAPGSAVYSFSDGDVLVTKGQSFKPFPTLDETHNGIEATYPEPLEKWGTKDAPARYSDDLEAIDGHRRLATGINFAAVPYPIQVQRLMLSMLLDDRRFRIHSFYLPPDSWLLEPNDVLSWSSARNGYVDKKFLVVQISGERSYNQLVLLKEIDPSDYDWDSSDELPTSVGPIGPIRPPVQQMTGWQVFPYTLEIAGKQLPSIQVAFDGDLDDVQFVRVEVRFDGFHDIVFDGTLPYGNPATNDDPKAIVLNGTFLPDTDYEVRGIFLPFSGRPTEWSDWLDVTTPNVWIGDIYPIDLERLAQDVKDFQTWMASGLRDALDRLDAVSASVSSISLVGYSDKQFLHREIRSESDNNKASWTEDITAATGPGSAIVADITALTAQIDDAVSTANIAFGTSATNLAGAVTATADAITALETTVNDPTTGLTAVASAVSSLSTTVTSQGSLISANSTAITALQTKIGDVSADATFRAETGYTPASGWTARIGLETRVTSAATFRAAGIYLESTASQARVIISADQLAILAGGVLAALFDSGTAYIANARIRNLTAGNIVAKSLNADVVMQDGTIITDLIALKALTDYSANTYNIDAATGSSWPSSFTTVQSIIVNNPVSNPVDVGINYQWTVTAGSGAFTSAQVRITRNGTAIPYTLNTIQQSSSGSNTQSFSATLVDIDAPTGSVTYAVQALVSRSGSGGFLMSGNIAARVYKR